MTKHFQHESNPIHEWHNLLMEGQEKSGHTLVETVEHYVVLTLDAYTREIKLATVTLAIEFLKHVRVATTQDYQTLRAVGDQCLILSGLFPERTKRKRVSPEYFKNIGESAYYTLSFSPVGKKINGALFYQLSENFSQVVEVLNATRHFDPKVN